MTTQSIMTTEVVTMTPDETVARGLQLMCEHRIHSVPVVDERGAFVGLFSLRRITHALLPKAAQLDPKFLLDLNFMPDDDDELHTRLQCIGRKPVSDLLEKKKKLRFCGPETPIPELLQLLHENPTSLPVLVVKGKDRILKGMVSNWDILTKLALVMLNSQTAADGCAPAGPSEETDVDA